MKALAPLLTIILAIAPVAAGAASPQRGEQLTGKYCGGCHATGRSGDSREPAAPKFRELNLRYEPEQLGEALAEGVFVGHPMMPEFRFSPDDVASVILYLKTIQTRQGG